MTVFYELDDHHEGFSNILHVFRSVMYHYCLIKMENPTR